MNTNSAQPTSLGLVWEVEDSSGKGLKGILRNFDL
jgi:hypothetical protein